MRSAGGSVTPLPMALTRLTACRPPLPRPRNSWSWRYCCRSMTGWWSPVSSSTPRSPAPAWTAVCATGERHLPAFDRGCADNHIEHRLIKPRTPQTNGMVERFNGRIAEVLATTRFDSSEHLTDTIKRYVQVYNQHIPQKALGHITPIQAMKKRVVVVNFDVIE